MTPARSSAEPSGERHKQFLKFLEFLLKLFIERADTSSMAPVSTLSLPADNTAPPGVPVALPTAIRLSDMAKLRLFASAREAAGTGSDAIDGATVADVLAAATQRYGSEFAEVLTTCRIWVNGNDVAPDTMVGPHDEVAVLPPVSGGST